MTDFVERFLAEGAPSPLTEMTDGWFAILHGTAESIRVVGAVEGWDLTAPPRWHTRRVYPIPWVAAGISEDNELVALNLTRVDCRKLPEGTRRAMELQAHQFCSTPQHLWAKSTVTTARYTHDGYLLVGMRRIPMKNLFATPETKFAIERGKTFHNLSPKQRVIAKLLDAHDGLTLDELLENLQRIAPQKKHTRAALHVELSRMRNQQKIAINKLEDGRYIVTPNSSNKEGQTLETVG